MTAAHETPEFRNAVEYTITLTYVVAGGARHGTADRRARVIASRLADTAARIPSVVDVHARAGPSIDGEPARTEVVRFTAANAGVADVTGRLPRYLDPEHEEALRSLEESNAAYRALRRADEARRAAVGCDNRSPWDARYCLCVYCRPMLHDPPRCPCGNLDSPGRCPEHKRAEVIVLADDPAELRDAARRYGEDPS